jgi:hypothetical protein
MKYSSLLFSKMAILFTLLLIVSCGGCSDSSGNGGTGDPPHDPDVTRAIGANGGIVSHPDGVRLEIPEGALDEPEVFHITSLDYMPQELPNDIEANDDVYEIEFDGTELKKPVTISLPLDDVNMMTDDGYLGIYKWDGESWYYAGGEVQSGEIVTYTDEFSVFIIGTGRSLHRPFAFQNSTGWDCTVFVGSYALAHPDIDAPLTGAFGVPVLLPPNNTPNVRGVYPQGKYRFCAEFWINEEDHPADDVGWYHVFIGSDTPFWDFELNENSSDVVPPQVLFDTIDFRYQGRCPTIRNVGAGAGTNPGGVVISGTWQFNLRCAVQDEDAAEVIVVINEAGGEFFGSGAGEDYDGTPFTLEIQGGYYQAENIISGTIRFQGVTTRVDTFSTQLLAATDYFTLSLEECNSSSGCCLAEARLTKLQ